MPKLNSQYGDNMNIILAPELEKFVQAQIDSGAYFSTSELFNEALHLLAEREEMRLKNIQTMDDFIDEGLAGGDDDLIAPEQAWKEVKEIIGNAERKHPKNYFLRPQTLSDLILH